MEREEGREWRGAVTSTLLHCPARQMVLKNGEAIQSWCRKRGGGGREDQIPHHFLVEEREINLDSGK